MHKPAYRILISVLIFAPLAFGVVEQWSLTIMTSASLLALALLFVPSAGKMHAFYEVPGIVPLAILAAYMLFQLIPLPATIVRLISPDTYTVYNDTIGTFGPLGRIPLSINPKATLAEFYRFSACLAFYILTIQVLTQKERLKQTVILVIGFAALLAMLATIQHFTAAADGSGAARKIFWFRELTGGGNPFGPYVNRNHYAGWMGMILPMALSMFLFYSPRPVNRCSWREKMTGLLVQDRTHPHILLGLAAVLIGASIFISLSRGGIISSGLSLFFFTIAISLTKTGREKRVRFLSLFIIILLLVGWLGWEPVLKRFDTLRHGPGDIAGQRLTIWQDSLNIARDFPVWGTGFGTFADIYPKYGRFSGDLRVKHAENDYLEWQAEGGIIGTILVAWFLGVWLLKTLKVLRQRKDPYSISLFWGALGGIAAIAIHGLVDFNLHIGANGLYLFFLLGITVSAANTRIAYRQGGTYLSRCRFARPMMVGSIGAGACLLIIITAAAGFIGERNHASIRTIRLRPDISAATLAEIERRARRACRLDPLEARFHYTAANIAAFGEQTDLALKHYRTAVRLNPTKGAYLHKLARVLSNRGAFAPADRLFRAAVKYDPSNSARAMGYAAWLFSRNRGKEAIAQLRRALTLKPDLAETSLTLMVLHGVATEDMPAALPERVEPYLLFGNHLDQIGKVEIAAAVYHKALDLIRNEKPVKWTYFDTICRFFERHNQLASAVDVLEKATATLPENPELRLRLAALYTRIGRTGLAVTEYKNVLDRDPQNKKAQSRLAQILAE